MIVLTIKKLTKILALGLILSAFAVPAAAGFVQPPEAAQAARIWLENGPEGVRGLSQAESVLYYKQKAFHPCAAAYDKGSADLPLLYLVNFSDGRFVLVSGDDNSVPVLAYSAVPTDRTQFAHASFLDWVQLYADQIGQIVSTGEIIPANSKLWQDLRAGQVNSGNRLDRSVSPLLATDWDQGWPYNELCPADNQGPGGHVYAGCVATAMAMVMKYWNHPATGVGNNTYYASGYGYQSANFGATTYLWDQMPNSVGSSNIPVATLLYHCGVAVNMDYAPDGSGAQSSDAADAMVEHFRYPGALIHSRSDYSQTEWDNMLTAQLDNGCPVYYSGSGSGGGHAFCIDGYSSPGYYHFNFGWSGSYNGYFYANNINPGGSNFNQWQAAIVNAIPENYSIATIPVRMKAQPPTVGNNFNLSVHINPILGSWNVNHYEFALFYDSTYMVFNGASVNNTIAANGNLTVTETEPGNLLVSWDGTNELLGSGDLVTFSFLPIDAGDYYFDILGMMLNSSPVANTEYLMLHVQAPVATLAQSQISMLNVMHLQYNAVGTTEIRTTYLLPSWNVNHYQFNLSYDPSKLEYVGTDTEQTLSAGSAPQIVLNAPGSLSVSCNSAEAITGDGALLKVSFRAIGNTSAITVTQVSPLAFFYNTTAITSVGSANFILAPYTAVDDEVALAVPSLQIWPNPVSGRASILLSSKLEQRAQLKIYNLKGQLLREFDGIEPNFAIDWDGTDGSGARLASGIYFLAWKQGGEEGRSRFLILK